MKSKRKHQQKKGTCAYCGKEAFVSDDHIPPKNLFAHPRPSNLITVPSCKKCHDNTSKDDEYFLHILSIRMDVHEHPDAKQNWKAIFESLRRLSNYKYVKYLFNERRKVDLFSRSGLYIGDTIAVKFDMDRLCKVVNRIIKGLFFLHMGAIIPAEYTITIYPIEGLNISLRDYKKDLKDFFLKFKNIEPIIIGNNVFLYKYLVASDDKYSSAWLLMFYGKVMFFALVKRMNNDL